MSRLGTTKERHLAQSLSARGAARRRTGLNAVLFRPTTLISLIFIGLFAFGALIVLNGFAADFKKTPPGQATPRSVSAVGYKALSTYLENMEYDILETRGERGLSKRKNRLVIYTPSRPTSRVERTLKSEGDAINLIVLPKWSVRQMRSQKNEESRKGWVRKTSKNGKYYEGTYKTTLKGLPVIRRLKTSSPDADVFFNTPYQNAITESYQPDFQNLQYFDLTARWPDFQAELKETLRQEQEARRKKAAEDRGKTYKPKKKKDPKKKNEETKEAEPLKPLPKHEVILKIDDKAVLIKMEDTQTYILSEPDLINTMGFKTQSGVELIHAILDSVIYDASAKAMSIDFDVSLHGIESKRNIIKLMVTPPFLAATLCLLAAGGLVGWQGFNRFGDPSRVRPDYAQGPVSLAQTAAEFMGIANRAHKTGEDYAALIRRQLITELGYKTRTTDDIDTLLDAREKRLNIQPKFVDLERSIKNADTLSYGHYAKALKTWRDAMMQSDFPQGPKDSGKT